MTFVGRAPRCRLPRTSSDLYDVRVPSNEEVVADRDERLATPRISAMTSGSVSMSSRWISMSLGAKDASLRLTAAWTALTSGYLPMPRAPHRRTLLGGSPTRTARYCRTKCRGRGRRALQEADVDAVDLGDRRERALFGAPDEGLGGVEIGLRRGRRREAIEGVGDAAEEGVGDPCVDLAYRLLTSGMGALWHKTPPTASGAPVRR